MQRLSLDVFHEDAGGGPPAEPVARLRGGQGDSHFAKQSRDAGALERLEVQVRVNFVLVAVGPLGVPPLEDDARREE